MMDDGADFRQQQEQEEQQQFEQYLAESIKWFHKQTDDFEKIFGKVKQDDGSKQNRTNDTRQVKDAL
jgi:hypothetical protein